MYIPPSSARKLSKKVFISEKKVFCDRHRMAETVTDCPWQTHTVHDRHCIDVLVIYGVLSLNYYAFSRTNLSQKNGAHGQNIFCGSLHTGCPLILDAPKFGWVPGLVVNSEKKVRVWDFPLVLGLGQIWGCRVLVDTLYVRSWEVMSKKEGRLWIMVVHCEKKEHFKRTKLRTWGPLIKGGNCEMV